MIEPKSHIVRFMTVFSSLMIVISCRLSLSQ
jgi:hypothetical protein